MNLTSILLGETEHKIPSLERQVPFHIKYHFELMVLLSFLLGVLFMTIIFLLVPASVVDYNAI